MGRGKECCRLFFGTADGFREYANRKNNCSPDELAKVTLGQLRVLKAISCSSVEGGAEGGMMLKTLAGKVSLTPGATSLIVDSLVKLGLLDRTTDEHDRRAVKIRLSEEGSKRFEEHFNFYIQTMDSIFEEIPERDVSTFMKVLSVIKGKIEEKQKV